MSLIVFPFAFMANTFAMMLVMIGLSVFGKPELAADFGLIHGATVAMFYAFSGNARSLILGESGKINAAQILRLRLIMLVPLAVLAFVLSIGVVALSWGFVLLLVLRRACEWVAEIFLGEQELHHHRRAAALFALVQGALSALLLLALVHGGLEVFPVLLIWAISPLFGSFDAQLAKRCLARTVSLVGAVKVLMPHVGSTAIIGVSVYVFRLFILLIAGKEETGDLFASFAMGGILGAVFSQALGPTMVRRTNNMGGGRLNRVFGKIMIGSALLGLVLIVAVSIAPTSLQWTNKSPLFWLAVGCSLLGGLVMVLAQRIRLEILQSSGGDDVFGSDMLANLLLVSSIPFFYYIAGPTSLAALYLFGAVLSLGFYMSEREGLLGKIKMFKAHEHRVLIVLAMLLFVPVFFQLSAGLYRTDMLGGSGGSLALLPIPISVFACYGGIVLLGKYSQARLSLTFLFFVFICMLLTTALLVGSQGSYQSAKFILLVQFMLPMFALVLGQQYGARVGATKAVPDVIFVVLMVFVPLQLLATFLSGGLALSSSVFVFKIYQHLQYVSVVFAALFLVALFSLFDNDKRRPWMLLLAATTSIYTLLSTSMLGTALLFAGIFSFSIRNLLLRSHIKASMLLVVLSMGGALTGFFYIIKAEFVKTKLGVSSAGTWEHAPANAIERLTYLRFYLNGVLENGQTFLLGHMQAPDRTLYPSAHNYYLDLVYNFGFVALLPFLALIGFTVYSVLRNFSTLWQRPYVLSVAGVVLFLVLVDNVFKVGMRQPYPGIVTFFFWGVLLTALNSLPKVDKKVEARELPHQ